MSYAGQGPGEEVCSEDRIHYKIHPFVWLTILTLQVQEKTQYDKRLGPIEDIQMEDCLMQDKVQEKKSVQNTESTTRYIHMVD